MLIPNQSSTQFDYTLPDGSTHTESRESNIVNTEILTYSFTKVKTSDHTFLQEGDIATQTVTLKNNSLYTIYNVFFKDTLSSGATYVAGSVVVGGVPQPTYDLIVGFNVGDLAPNASIVITYQIKANNPLTNVIVTNYATVSYTADSRNLQENSNIVEIAVVSNRLTILKSVDKSVATKGEILHYTSNITNSGTLQKTNLVFTDNIPSGTTFVSDSVKINGTTKIGFNPQTGFALPNLAVGESVVVEFDVMVN